MPGERVQLYNRIHQCVQTVEAPPHVAGRGREIDPHAGRRMHYRSSRNTLSTASKVAASKLGAIRSRSPKARKSSVATSLRRTGIHFDQRELHRKLRGNPFSPLIETMLADAVLSSKSSHRHAALLLLHYELTPDLPPRLLSFRHDASIGALRSPAMWCSRDAYHQSTDPRPTRRWPPGPRDHWVSAAASSAAL